MSRHASLLAPLAIAAAVGLSLVGLHRAEQFEAQSAVGQQLSLEAQQRFVARGEARDLDAQLGELDRVHVLAGEATSWRTASLFLLIGASILGLALVMTQLVELAHTPEEQLLPSTPTFLPKA
jgi:hypothetical protein